ncbi:hypothetical protein BpHYR1_045742 [Brachionus plicatilis]|uniref:Uncharacterized protein n=1 Tax=Brachionus plicatilis TaxID=10195 RepID=A0A3M7Q5T4_BRAPC|nr:hypothetical protein BpHYR1_045742 [Brachionus plicatilis]
MEDYKRDRELKKMEFTLNKTEVVKDRFISITSMDDVKKNYLNIYYFALFFWIQLLKLQMNIFSWLLSNPFNTRPNKFLFTIEELQKSVEKI